MYITSAGCAVLEVILWTISILMQSVHVHMCYGEPVYCMVVVYTCIYMCEGDRNGRNTILSDSGVL